MPVLRASRILVTVYAAFSLIGGISLAAEDGNPRESILESVHFPADFEKQGVLLLGWDKVDPPVQQVVLSIARAVVGRIPAIILAPSEADRKIAERRGLEAGIPAEALRIATVPINTCWVRDFAPIAVEKTSGLIGLVDPDYIADKRRDDDAVGKPLGSMLGLPVERLPLIVEGGNLLSNGRGLLVTTSKLADENTARDLDRAQVEKMLGSAFGARDVVHLEPLLGEMTGHVDMFVAFTAADTVVVASSTKNVDRINTEILERNAAELADVHVGGKPLNVVRLPMPPRVFEVWRSYTNVIFANGIILVPKYANVDDGGHAEAVAAYRKLLPKWSPVSIDCEPLARIGGALRCVSATYVGVKLLPPTVKASGSVPRSP